MVFHVFYERIFTNAEIQLFEKQITLLVKQQKEFKIYVKEEFKKVQLRLEKELLDAQQDNQTQVPTIEKAVEIAIQIQKQVEESVEKDVQRLEEQLENLKNFRYERDYWNELELKSVIGDYDISFEDFKDDLDQQLAVSKESIEGSIKKIRDLIDQLDFKEIVKVLRELGSE